MNTIIKKICKGITPLILLTLLVIPTAQAAHEFEITVDSTTAEPITSEAALAEVGEEITIRIEVKNVGTSTDEYTVSAIESEEWGLQIENQTLTIPPNESKYAGIKTTVPENTNTGIQNDITITATNSTETTKETEFKIGVLGGFETNEKYIATGMGVFIIAVIIVLARWKGPLAG